MRVGPLRELGNRCLRRIDNSESLLCVSPSVLWRHSQKATIRKAGARVSWATLVVLVLWPQTSASRVVRKENSCCLSQPGYGICYGSLSSLIGLTRKEKWYRVYLGLDEREGPGNVHLLTLAHQGTVQSSHFQCKQKQWVCHTGAETLLWFGIRSISRRVRTKEELPQPGQLVCLLSVSCHIHFLSLKRPSH